MGISRPAILKLRLNVALLFFFIIAFAARAEILTCDVCGKPLEQRFFTREDAVAHKQVRLCEECSRSLDRCFLCDLPVREGFQHLPDGRFICARELKTVITSEVEAKQICSETKDDLDRLMSRFLTLPADDHIQLAIVDRFRLENLFHAPAVKIAAFQSLAPRRRTRCRETNSCITWMS